MFEGTLTTQVIIFGAFLYSVVLHEVAHGYIAEALGDPTARYAGRLTLNPFPHLDLMGSFLLPLILAVSGAPVFGYAKPVPYDPNKLRDRRWDPIKVMAAGPLTNIGIAIVLGLVLRLVGIIGPIAPAMAQILGTAVFLNLVLAVFNLIPLPPFDGRLFLGIISPTLLYRWEISMARMGAMGWIVGLFLGLFIIFPLVFPLIPIAFRLITGIAL
jgi:Zn-dependent protease